MPEEFEDGIQLGGDLQLIEVGGLIKVFDVAGAEVPFVAGTSLAGMVGATASVDGAKGAVPQPLLGQEGAYLRGDGVWASPAGTNPYGSEFFEVEDNGTTSRTSSSYAAKTTLSCTGLSASSKYRLEWSCEARSEEDDDDSAVGVRVRAGSTTHAEFLLETEDDSGFYTPCAGFRILTGLSGSVAFTLELKQVGEGTAYLRRRRMTLTRIA